MAAAPNTMSAVSSQLEQARRLHNEGKHEQARAAVLRVLQKAPGDPIANQIMAALLTAAHKHEQALYYIDRALTAAPNVPGFLLIKATILSNTPRVFDAIPVLRRAVELEPSNAQAWCILGVLESGSHRHADAEASLRRSLELRPGHPEALAPLAALLLDTGDPEQAVDMLRAGVAIHPSDIRLAETLAFCLNYDHRASAAEVFEAHRTYGALLEASVDARAADAGATERAAPRDPASRIRVGYMSPDLRKHAVATFFAPVLANHDRDAFEVFIYHTSPVVDDETRRLQAMAEHWFGSRSLGEAELLSRLRADRLDILVELSGLSSQNRLAVMARRPARVQASFIGYPNTTGLTRIDHLIVDAVTDPPGAEALATEHLARLPSCLLCYSPPMECPEVAPPPCTLREGDGSARPFTFASFNTVGKTTGFTLRLWARVLETVPGSRLLLKASGLSDPAMHDRFLARAEAAGIPRDRLDLLGFTPRAEHMGSYAGADVCLDPFPFNGATTTCDALWMGVPVVTLAGDRHVARASASILTAVGHPEWIASSADEYVRIAARLAGDPAGLAAVRRELRQTMRASPLCDAPGYTRGVESLYRSWAGA